uniref:Putative extracellular protein CSOL_081 n=1 Tax=Pseudococcomyxa simplex TaxID=464287 RepID=A0A7L9QE94_9CHLO|nr:putative extracellular protein CSOL_081 [Pseudococcomyxa simplex]
MASYFQIGLLVFVCASAVQGAGTGRKLLYEDTQTASFSGGAAAQQGSDSAAYQSTQSAPAGNTANAAASNQAAPAGNTWQDALGTIQRSATAAFNANNNVPVQQQQQAAQVSTAQTGPKNVLLDLAPGASVGFGNQNGYPKISAQAPGTGFSVAQAPGKDSPDVSFKVGPQDSPVAVTLGQQPGLDGGADKAESGLSGTLNLGHYGVSQSNSFEAVNINPAATELITPFAKLNVPYKAFTSVGPALQQIPGQLAQLTKVFQVQSTASAPAPAAFAAMAPSTGVAAQAAP